MAKCCLIDKTLYLKCDAPGKFRYEGKMENKLKVKTLFKNGTWNIAWANDVSKVGVYVCHRHYRMINKSKNQAKVPFMDEQYDEKVSEEWIANNAINIGEAYIPSLIEEEEESASEEEQESALEEEQESASEERVSDVEEEETKAQSKVYRKSHDQLKDAKYKRRRLQETQAVVDEHLGSGIFKLVEVDVDEENNLENLSLEMYIHVAKSKERYKIAVKSFQTNLNAVNLLGYEKVVKLYKSKCPVGVQKCNNIEDCLAEGHCANVMFDDIIAFLIDMVYPQEHVIKFTIQQKRNLMND